MNTSPEDKVKAIRLAHEALIESFTLRTCLNCESFNFTNDNCERFKMKPPLDIIVFSCGKNWVGRIPF